MDAMPRCNRAIADTVLALPFTIYPPRPLLPSLRARVRGHPSGLACLDPGLGTSFLSPVPVVSFTLPCLTVLFYKNAPVHAHNQNARARCKHASMHRMSVARCSVAVCPKAADQKTTKTYELNLLRLPMDDATLKNMRIEKGTSMLNARRSSPPSRTWL